MVHYMIPNWFWNAFICFVLYCFVYLYSDANYTISENVLASQPRVILEKTIGTLSFLQPGNQTCDTITAFVNVSGQQVLGLFIKTITPSAFVQLIKGSTNTCTFVIVIVVDCERKPARSGIDCWNGSVWKTSCASRQHQCLARPITGTSNWIKPCLHTGTTCECILSIE